MKKTLALIFTFLSLNVSAQECADTLEEVGRSVRLTHYSWIETTADDGRPLSLFLSENSQGHLVMKLVKPALEEIPLSVWGVGRISVCKSDNGSLSIVSHLVSDGLTPGLISRRIGGGRSLEVSGLSPNEISLKIEHAFGSMTIKFRPN